MRDLCDFSALGDLENVTKIFALEPHDKLIDLGQTAGECIWRAAMNGHTACVEHILEQGCAINQEDGKPLQLATEGGHMDTVKMLIERGADINMPATFTGWTALHYAAKAGHLDIVDYLVKSGAVVGLKTHDEHNGDFSGWSALHFAADDGHLDICQFLVEVGKCIIDQENAANETALSIAAEHGQFEVVKYLVTAGAHIHAKRRGLTVVQWAIYRCSPETVQFLVSYGGRAHLDIKTLWFPLDLTLKDVIKRELSDPLYDKLDLAIYRGSVKLQERAGHMRALSEITWEEGTLYDPNNDEPMEPSGDMFVLPKHILHLISAYEI